MSTKTDRPTQGHRKPMQVEKAMFFYLGLFFVIVAVAYLFVSSAEPVGTVCFFLLAVMCLFVAAYLHLQQRSTTPRWEDNPDAVIAERTGEVGEFSPQSWAPFTVGLAATIGVLAPVFGWWILVIAVAVLVIGLVDWMFEFNRGIHKH